MDGFEKWLNFTVFSRRFVKPSLLALLLTFQFFLISTGEGFHILYRFFSFFEARKIRLNFMVCSFSGMLAFSNRLTLLKITIFFTAHRCSVDDFEDKDDHD